MCAPTYVEQIYGFVTPYNVSYPIRHPHYPWTLVGLLISLVAETSVSPTLNNNLSSQPPD